MKKLITAGGVLFLAMAVGGCDKSSGEAESQNTTKTSGAQTENSGSPTDTKVNSAASPAKPQVISVNPKDILFSISTINDGLPFGSDTPADAKTYRTHEDNWRQFEFVDASFNSAIDQEIADIDRIWKEQSVPVGDGMTAFRNLHVRKRIPAPIDIAMTPADFEKLIGGKASTMTFIDAQNSLRNVYAVQLKTLAVYGVIEDGRLKVLAIDPDGPVALPPATADRLEKFITDHNLRLVHWPSRSLFPNAAEAMIYLRGKNSKS